MIPISAITLKSNPNIISISIAPTSADGNREDGQRMDVALVQGATVRVRDIGQVTMQAHMSGDQDRRAQPSPAR